MSADPYVEYVFLEHILSSAFDDAVGDRWVFAADMEKAFQEAVSASLQQHGFGVGRLYTDIAESYLSALLTNGIMQTEGDEYTGTHYKFSVLAKDKYVRAALSEHPVGRRIAALGSEALQRALNAIASQEGWDRQDAPSLVASAEPVHQMAPASDRVVTFSDNQVHDLDEQTSELIDTVSAQNQIAEEPGLRELIIGQLKAGRELLRAGSFKMYLIQHTLIDTLTFLAKRYERETIGALAAALVAALANQLGFGS